MLAMVPLVFQILLTYVNYCMFPITKTLINVSKFVNDNKVYFEFHAHICVVNSQVTNQVLFKGVVDINYHDFCIVLKCHVKDARSKKF